MKKAFYLILAIMLTCFTSPVYSFERVDNQTYKQMKNENKSFRIENIISNPIKEQSASVSKSKKKKQGKFLSKKKKITNDNNPISTTFLVISTILSLLSIITVIFSLILGGVLLLFALLFLILGLSTKTKNSKIVEKQNESMRDLVYLKNGSVVKGIIIEQIPNETLKIETGDGSIFVYKMDEIEKIAKEKSK